jgi:hypothetical protein
MNFFVQRLRELQDEVKSIKDSEEYKRVSRYGNAWIARNAHSDEEQRDLASWQMLKQQLDALEAQRKDWVRLIESTHVQQVKKKDTTRKDYKREMAVRSQRGIVNTIASQLYADYDFPILFEDPTFGDVLAAVGFYNRNRICKYFATKMNPDCKYTKREGTIKDLENVFTQDQWMYLFQMHNYANTKLHRSLPMDQGKMTVVVENELYAPETIRGIFKVVMKTKVEIDVKNAESL